MQKSHTREMIANRINVLKARPKENDKIVQKLARQLRKLTD